MTKNHTGDYQIVLNHDTQHDSDPHRPIELTIKLPFIKPLLWEPLKKALLAHMVPGLENVDEKNQTLQRLIKTSHGYVNMILSLKPPVDTIDARLVVPSMEDVDEVATLIKRVFDLDCRPETIQQVFAADPLLGPLVAERPGLRVCGMFDPFELLINTIIGQQISVAAARTFSARLVQHYGQWIDNLYTFPSAEVLLMTDPFEIYEHTRLNHKKIATIQAVCRLVVDGLNLADGYNEDVKQKLLAVKGIGPWTVEYLALRGYGDPDGFPSDDLFIKRALGAANGKAAEKIAEQWRPYRGYATMYIWTKGAYT